MFGGEAYQVDYIIRLNDQATAGIRTFSQATKGLTKAAENLKKFEATFNEVAAKLNQPIAFKVDQKSLNRLHNSLNKILEKVRAIKKEAGSISVGVGAGAGRGQNRNTVVTPSSSTRARQQAPRPLVASKAGQPMIPRNLEYQVLGPTRLGNVSMLDMFKGMGVMYGISAIGSGIGNIIRQSTEYENIMQTAKNILKTNYKGNNFNASFVDMERIVREVGVETKFTAPEVADAVKFLAMAGLDINAINKSIRPIADIALIGDTDLGQTADVMTNIMTAYGIRPEDMRKTADVMTRTFTMSNTTLMELAESFKMAGSMLHLANVPFETAAAAFGVLGDAGIKATMAGTTMRTIMNNLRNPTKNQQKYWDMLGIRRYDDYGNLRDINDIFGDLYRLNGNDERSRAARAKYEELQKQYAPKFEGLQEGSQEWNELVAAYDKASESIRKQFGGVDVFRLFRLTAASGAGVLMNSVEKWNKIIEENFLSEGMSQKLADEKKNTIAGLWAQLKSAFQEGGLKVFNENDGQIRGYLQQGISWLKSSEFTTLLRDVFDMVISLGRALKQFTSTIVTLYDRFRPLVKYFLTFQLYAKGAQTIITSLMQVWRSGMYMFSPFFSAVGGSAFVQRRMSGLAGFANAYTATANGAVMPIAPGLMPGVNPLLSFWAGRKMPSEYFVSVAGNQNIPIPMQMPMTANTMSGIATYNKQLSAYRRRSVIANKMQSNGMFAGIGGALAGSYLGSAIAPESEWAGAIGGLLGSTGSIALASMAIPGAGWIAAGVMAASALTAYLIKQARAAKEAKAAADAYYESIGKLNVESWNIGNQKDFFVAAVRIRSNSLISEQEKLNASIDLWRKYYKAMNGEEETYEPSKGSFYNENTTARSLIDGLIGKAGNAFKNELLSKMTENGNMEKAEAAIRQMFGEQLSAVPNLTWYELLGIGGGAAYRDNLYNSLQSAPGLLFASTALDQNNPLFNKIAIWREEAEKGVGSIEDVERRMEEFRKLFMTPSGDFMSFDEQAKVNVKDLKEKYSYADWLRFPTFYALMLPQLQKELDDYKKSMTAVFNGEQNAIQGVYMSQIFGGLNTTAAFGSPEFKKAYNNWLATVPIDEVARKKMPQNAFQNLLEIFKNVSEQQKMYLLPMLNRDYWERALGVDISHIEGGFYPPTQDNQKPYGDMFTWNAEKGIWEYNGQPSLPGSWSYNPVPVPAQSSGATNATGPTAYNIPFYNPYVGGNVMPQPNSVNAALAQSSTRQTLIQPVAKTNNLHFDFHIDTVRTDMDEDELQAWTRERVVPILIETINEQMTA